MALLATRTTTLGDGDATAVRYETGAESEWRPLYRIAGVASLMVAAFIAIQTFVFLAWPPPSTVSEAFRQLHQNPVLGLLDQDLLMVADYVVLIPVFLALYLLLRRVSPAFMTLGLVIALVGTAIYITSLTPFNMLMLSSQYAAATTDAQRSTLLAAGQATLTTYSGTAYDVGYVMVGGAWLIFTLTALRSSVIGPRTAWVGVVMAALMTVPANVGTVGLVIAMLSLIPGLVWFVLIARKFFQLGGGTAFGPGR